MTQAEAYATEEGRYIAEGTWQYEGRIWRRRSAMTAGAGRKMARGDGKSTGRKVKGKGEVKGEARAEAKRGGRQNASPGVAAEAALSFLKETKGVVIWGVKELGETLKIGRGEAEAVAVAFGDFLRSERARVQAADVGIRLVRRGAEEGEMRSAADAKAERAFLRVLRGRAAMVQLRDCAEWMGRRAYRKLL